MNTSVIQRLCTFAIALCTLASPVLAVGAQAHWPRTGHLVFEVLNGEGGLKLGESEHHWQHDGNRYRMSTVMETTGLVALLQAFTYTQTSEGRVRNGQLLPDDLTIDHRKGQDNARFDWSSGQVLITRKQKQRSFVVQAGDVDMLSVWHVVAVHGLTDQPERFQVVTNRAAYPVRFQSLEQTSLTLPAGRFDTRHVRFEAESGSLRIDMWLSTAHGLIPVRVLMVDDKDQTLDQRLIRMSLP